MWTRDVRGGDSTQPGRATKWTPGPRSLAIAAVVVAAAVMTTPPGEPLESAQLVAKKRISVSISVDRTKPVGTSKLALGTSMGQNSLDGWGDPASIASGQALLDGATTLQNQFIYGWGAVNPEVSKGNYDFSSLDRRVAIMNNRANAVPVITLCGAPDWMTAQGTNTSNYNLQLAPTPEHYGDFAELSRQIALRYSAPSNPKPVLYYQVWSEMRGFWSATLNNYDYVAYTKFYNLVYDALKSVNPAIRVGGPYLVIEADGAAQDLGVPLNYATANPISSRQKTFLEYWFANKRGADFISIDRGIQDPHDTNVYTDDQRFKLAHWFGDVVTSMRTLNGYRGEPIWWSEAFAFANNAKPAVQVAAEAAALRASLLAGADALIKWQDEGTYNIGSEVVTGLFTSTLEPGGGQPYPVYTAYKLFHDLFPPGTTLYSTTSTSGSVLVTASATRTLLINTTESTVSVAVNGTRVSLSPYAVTGVAA